jgi:anti-sigma B factor antagonist
VGAIAYGSLTSPIVLRAKGVIVAVPFTIAESQHDGLIELALSGEIDLASVPAIRDRVSARLADSDAGIVIDLTEVTFIDSSGIGALITCQRMATAAARTYRVVNAQGRVADVLDLTGVMQLLAGP